MKISILNPPSSKKSFTHHKLVNLALAKKYSAGRVDSLANLPNLHPGLLWSRF